MGGFSLLFFPEIYILVHFPCLQLPGGWLTKVRVIKGLELSWEMSECLSMNKVEKLLTSEKGSSHLVLVYLEVLLEFQLSISPAGVFLVGVGLYQSKADQ